MMNHLSYNVLSRLVERPASPVEDLRAQRHLGGTTVGAPQPTTEWRVPSGPLARHLAHAEAPAKPEQKDETVRPQE